MGALLKNYVAIVLLSVPMHVYADGSAGERELQNVRVVDNQIITVTAATGATFNNPDNCGNSSIAVVQATEAGADRKLTLALAAFMGGRK